MYHYHKEHKILHSAYSFLAVVIAATCWLGSLGLWYAAKADTVTSTRNVQITAQVGDVNDGPVSSTGTEGYAQEYPKPILQLPQPGNTASLLIVGDTPEVEQIPGQDPVYIFRNSLPRFSGTTNITGAILIFEIRSITSRYSIFQPENPSRWLWTTPEENPDGDYELLAKSYNPISPELFATSKIKFRIITKDTKVPQDQNIPKTETDKPINTDDTTKDSTPQTEQSPILFLTKIKQGSKIINPGQAVFVNVQIISAKNQGVWKQPFTYTIFNKQNQKIAEIKEVVNITSKSNFTKLLQTAPNIKPGDYTLVVTTEFSGNKTTSADTFTVQGKPVLLLGTHSIDMTAIYLSLFLLGLVFLLIGYFEFRQVGKISKLIHQLTEKDLLNAHLIK